MQVLTAVAREVGTAAKQGVEVAVVVGGGNYFRGASAWDGLERATADYVGMLATCMNALMLQVCFLLWPCMLALIFISLSVHDLGEGPAPSPCAALSLQEYKVDRECNVDIVLTFHPAAFRALWRSKGWRRACRQP